MTERGFVWSLALLFLDNFFTFGVVCDNKWREKGRLVWFGFWEEKRCRFGGCDHVTASEECWAFSAHIIFCASCLFTLRSQIFIVLCFFAILSWVFTDKAKARVV